MASNDAEYENWAFARYMRKMSAQGPRSTFTRGRALEANIAGQQLRVASRVDLRSDSGQMFFVTGYSAIGGPDVAM